MDWPADKIERRKVDALIPYARNARTHSDDQVAQIAASIKEWGWTTPVLIDEDGGIIAGHGRVMAARKLGIKQIPTMTATGWSKAQKQAYVLADNQLPQNAEWDLDLLAVEMKDLDSEGFDLSLVGFGDDMLANMLVDETDGLTDEDAVPDVPENPVTVEGDVWLLGNHRLMCGDSTSIDAVEKLMGDSLASALVTDPPYLVTPTSKTHYEKPGMIKGGWMGKDYPVNHGKMFEVPEFDDWMPLSFAVCDMDADCYIMSNDRNLSDIIESAEKCGWRYHNILAWVKPNGIPNRWYFKDMEFTFYGFKGHAQTINNPSSTQSFKCNHAKEKEHMSQKPVDLFVHYIENSTKSGGLVYEPFGGSGTTIIACEKTSRTCNAMELDPKYCDVIVKRWCEFTGQQAKLEESGETFSPLLANAS
jgi:DNA modification methylase